MAKLISIAAVGAALCLAGGAARLEERPAAKEEPWKGGSISLQAESHPIEFRKVELQKIEP